jgi:Retrotransposon gag protein
MSKNNGPIADPQVKAMYEKFQIQMKESEDARKKLQFKLEEARAGNAKGIKIEPPEKFDGKRSQLRSFLTHAKLYLTFKEHQFPTEAKKVLAIAAFLKGQAFEWFEPRMRDYLEKDYDNRDAATDELFNSYENFAKELASVFGEVDEKRSAERELRMLKQTGSAKQYATEFRRITAKLNRDEESLMSDFYAGLKPFIKTEFALREPDDLEDIIK